MAKPEPAKSTTATAETPLRGAAGVQHKGKPPVTKSASAVYPGGKTGPEPMQRDALEAIRAFFERVSQEEGSAEPFVHEPWRETMAEQGWVEVEPDKWRKKPEWVDAFFTEEGTIDDDAFGDLLEHQVGARVLQKSDGVFFELTHEQKMHLRNAVRLEEANEREQTRGTAYGKIQRHAAELDERMRKGHGPRRAHDLMQLMGKEE